MYSANSVNPYSFCYGEKIIALTEKVEKWSVIAFKISILSFAIISSPFLIASFLAKEPVLPTLFDFYPKIKIWKLSFPIPIPRFTPERREKLRQALASSPICQTGNKLIFLPPLISIVACSTLILSTSVKCMTSLYLRKDIRWDNLNRLVDVRSI